MWYLYILECKDGSYYTGISSNLDRRIQEHLNGKGGKTKTDRKAGVLVYYETYKDKYSALAREKQIKGWNRQKKEQLIQGLWKQI